jgi:hypothetical protein
MGRVYNDFKNRLIRKNICYEGMAYRRIFEQLRTKKLSMRYDKVIFAGFSQLISRESIMKLLLESVKLNYTGMPMNIMLIMNLWKQKVLTWNLLL